MRREGPWTPAPPSSAARRRAPAPAPAPPGSPRPRGDLIRLAAGVLGILTAGFAGPAAAQFAGKLSLQSDYEVRGYSVSQGRPVGMLDLSYDAPSGLYLNESTFGALPDGDDAGLLGLIGDVGYARRLGAAVSTDVGVTHSEYLYVGPGGTQLGYTEIYGGLSAHGLSAHLYYSPAYFRTGSRTLYTDLAGNFGTVAQIRINLHLGVLDYLERPAGVTIRNQYDWLVGASRQFGAFDVHAAVSGGGPDPDYYNQQMRPKTKLIVGAGYTF